MASKRITDLTAGTPLIGHSIAMDNTAGSNATEKVTIADLLTFLGIQQVAVASLGAATTANKVRWATDGRKVGEGAAAGTGVLCISNGTNWIAYDSGATVAA